MSVLLALFSFTFLAGSQSYGASFVGWSALNETLESSSNWNQVGWVIEEIEDHPTQVQAALKSEHPDHALVAVFEMLADSLYSKGFVKNHDLIAFLRSQAGISAVQNAVAAKALRISQAMISAGGSVEKVLTDILKIFDGVNVTSSKARSEIIRGYFVYGTSPEVREKYAAIIRRSLPFHEAEQELFLSYSLNENNFTLAKNALDLLHDQYISSIKAHKMLFKILRYDDQELPYSEIVKRRPAAEMATRLLENNCGVLSPKMQVDMASGFEMHSLAYIRRVTRVLGSQKYLLEDAISAYRTSLEHLREVRGQILGLELADKIINAKNVGDYRRDFSPMSLSDLFVFNVRSFCLNNLNFLNR